MFCICPIMGSFGHVSVLLGIHYRYRDFTIRDELLLWMLHCCDLLERSVIARDVSQP